MALWRTAMAMVGIVVMTVLIALVLFILALKGQDVALPQWALDPLEAELTAVQDDVTVSFESAYVTVDDQWQPSIILTGVALNRADEPSFLQLGRVDAAFSLSDALLGTLAATHINVEGVFLTLLRDLDGKLRFQFGEFDTGSDAVPDVFSAISGLDTALGSDQLSKLETLQILAITLNYQDRRTDRSWTVDGARFMANRDGDTLFLRSDLALLTGGSDVATLEANYSSVIGENSAEVGIILEDIQSRDIATQSVALSWLGVLNAPISGALRLEILPEGVLGPLNGTLQIGEGALQPSQRAKPIPFDAARTYFSFDPETSNLDFSEIALESRDVSLTAEGYAQLTYDDAWPSGMVSQLALQNIKVNPEQFDNPLDFQKAIMDFDLTFDPFRIRVGQVYLEDKERDVAISGSGQIEADNTGWDVALDLQSERATVADVRHYWQPQFIDKVREWVDRNVIAGTVSDIAFAFRTQQEDKPLVDLSFAFDEATVKAVKFLPNLTDANGYFSLSNNVLSAIVKSARVRAAQGGDVIFNNAQFVIKDTRQKPAQAYVDFSGKGTITAVVDLLNAEPLSVMTRIKQPVTLADGTADLSARIEFPIKKGAKPEEIKYTANATLNNVKTSKLIKDRVLSAPRLELAVNNTSLSIDGSGRFDGLPFTGEFTTGIGKSPDTPRPAVKAGFDISSAVFDALSIPLSSGLFSGSTPATLAILFPKDASPIFSVESNLVGARLKIDGVGWVKPKRSAGKLDLEGRLGKQLAITQLDVSGSGATLKSKVRFTQDQKFQSLDISQFKLGNGINVSGAFLPNGVLRIDGGRVDLASFLARQNSGGSGSGGLKRIDINLDRLIVAENQELNRVKGSLALNGGPNGTFNALVNNQAQVAGRITPKRTGIDLIITSKNAGRVLSALGALDKANGGDLVLTLGATNQPGVSDGRLHVTGVKVQNAPVLAELFNVISVVGLLEQLNGPGLLLSEIDARFRMTPSQVIVSEASAVGPSMGLSVDGYYDLKPKSFDFQGVISPLYLLNGIGQVFTRKGEGLIGFNFNLKGDTAKPRFSVNPFSILTPAMFREIFRRPAPKLD